MSKTRLFRCIRALDVEAVASLRRDKSYFNLLLARRPAAPPR